MIALLYPMKEEVGGEPINNDHVKSILIGFGPKSASFVSDNINDDTDLAILLGTAGSLSEELSIGDIVVCNRYFSSDGHCLYADALPLSLVCRILENEGLKFHIGASLTVPRFGDNPEADALIIDMENFYVAKVLRRKGIPLATVRIVSDINHEKISPAQLMMRTPTLGVSLHKRFVIPFLKQFNQKLPE